MADNQSKDYRARMKAELRQKGIYPNKLKSEPYFRFVDHIKTHKGIKT